MKYFFIFMLFLFFLILLVILLPVQFRFQFSLIENKIQMNLYISYIFGLFGSDISIMDSRKLREFDKDGDMEGPIGELDDIFNFTKYLWRKFSIVKLKSKIIIGSKHPLSTSLLYSLLWMAQGLAIEFLLSYKDIEDLQLDIEPVFGENRLDVSFDCIIRIKMVYIINVWRKFLLLYKGGGKNDNTSNRGINEIYNG